MALDVYSIFKFNFNCTEALFYRSKINSYDAYSVMATTSRGGGVNKSLRREYVLLLTHTLTSTNQIN